VPAPGAEQSGKTTQLATSFSPRVGKTLPGHPTLTGSGLQVILGYSPLAPVQSGNGRIGSPFSPSDA